MKTPKINRFFLDQSFLCRNYMLKKNDENVIIELKKAFGALKLYI